MSDSLNRAGRYHALAEECRLLAAASPSAKIRDRCLQMADSLNLAERYCALAEEYSRLAPTTSSAEIRDRDSRTTHSIAAGRPSPKNQADQPTTIGRQVTAT